MWSKRLKGVVSSETWLTVVVMCIAAPAMSQERLDVANMPRPIEALDSVWIEELTMMDVRDAIQEGKTTALILTGGIEENGPYLATGKHNYVLQVMGESIARELGDALVAPIVTLEPGNPERVRTPGTIYLSPETYKSVLRDMATSLKSQGFTDIFLLGDSGGNQTPMREVAETLSAAWGRGPTRITFVPEYYNYDDVREFEETELVPRIFNYYTKSGSPCVSSVRWAKRAIDSRIWSADLVHLNGFGSSLWASR